MHLSFKRVLSIKRPPPPHPPAWTPKIKKTLWAFIIPKVIYGIHYFYFSSKSFISWGHKQDDS